MIIAPRFLSLAILAAMTALPLLTQAEPQGTTKEIPEPLRGWEGWATWDDAERRCPSPYQDPAKHLCFWPSLLALEIENGSGRFNLEVSVFSETWIPLPGGRDVWPVDVKASLGRAGRGSAIYYLGYLRDSGDPTSCGLTISENGSGRLELPVGRADRLPAIEAKGELGEIGIEVSIGNGPLVSSQEPSLKQRHHPMNTRE